MDDQVDNFYSMRSQRSLYPSMLHEWSVFKGGRVTILTALSLCAQSSFPVPTHPPNSRLNIANTAAQADMRTLRSLLQVHMIWILSILIGSLLSTLMLIPNSFTITPLIRQLP